MVTWQAACSEIRGILPDNYRRKHY